jgi:hypothetical protein
MKSLRYLLLNNIFINCRLMEVNNFLVTTCQTNKTRLDKLYYEHINYLLNDLDEEEEIKWETYGLIVESLLKQGHKNVLTELKYRMTDGENTNQIILDMVNRYSDSVDGMVWFLKRRVEEYLEEDFYKKLF